MITKTEPLGDGLFLVMGWGGVDSPLETPPYE